MNISFCNMKCMLQKTPYFMWLIALLFFAYQFILRLWPGLMMESILIQFSIDASLFGTIAAFYYYGYALMQIPVAILLERFGARHIISLFALICGIAAIIFTHTQDFYIALISRFFIGAGSAVGFLGVSKIISEWFDAKYYTRMVGFSFTFGLLGAVYGGKPVGILIETYNPDNIAYIISSIPIVLACLAYAFLRNKKDYAVERISSSSEEQAVSLSGLKTIISSKTIWLLAIANLLLVGSLEGFADVWGVQYLVESYGIVKSDAAGIVSFIFIGMLFGGPTLAWLSEKFGDVRVIILCGVFMAFILFAIFAQIISSVMLPYAFFLVGIMCCYQVLVFSVGSKLVPPASLGICVAFLNSINMLGGSFYHTIIGKVMDIFWQGAYSPLGCKIYGISAYTKALSVIPVCGLIGAALFIGFARMQRHGNH